jgi:hypothetical protein
VRDCTNPANNQGCDCPLTATPDDQTSKPLCNPDAAQDHLQTHAKAYPGTRFLSAIRSLGAQGIVGSVCPKQLTNPDARDFGYRPAIQAIIDRLKTALGGQCLPRTLSPDASGQVACLIIEGRNTSGQCTCDIPGRTAVPAESAAAIEQAKKDPSAAGADCFCAVTQLTGDELTACQTDEADNPVVNGAQVDGWCYVDATTTPPVGNPAIVAGCPDTERRIIRFVGEGEAAGGATLFITCSGDS